ncbi:unnamed protein product [Pieris brassicae]|uniref:Spaetzle domain-containing protein n=1 Tax=Pieris brassicae TaxID=7116 RepID=A0A9P0THP1_PIEBR|nr:unnamed protein product [Pieris brassicae]
MALANFTVPVANVASPDIVTTSSTPLRVDLDDLLYSPEEQRAEYASQYTGNEPFLPPSSQQQKRPKVRKRAGTAYLPPPNHFTQYPRQNEVPLNPFNSPLQVPLYQNSRLDVQVPNQRVQGTNGQYDNNGQYIHDPTGDYDYEQRRIGKTGTQVPTYPGYADLPYQQTNNQGQTSSRFDGNSNKNNNFGPVTTAAPSISRKQNEAGKRVSNSGITPPDTPRGFTKVETGTGGNTQLHAVLDYDDDDYYEDDSSGGIQPSVTPLQGPILLRNGTVPVVPLTSYPTVNNGSFYQIPILWTALSVALGYELQGQIIRGVPCVKRNFQLYCPTAGNTYPLDKIETFIDENKALIKRMYGSFAMPSGARVRRAPGVPDMHAGIPDTHSGDSYFRRHVRQAKPKLPDAQAVNSTGRIDACESKTEIMTPYWALNSARKLRAIVNTMHFEQAIHQEVCSKQSTSRCSGDCGCEQKYKWHRLLAYDPSDDCAGIFMDWFLFPSCCVCRCKP